MFKACKTFRFFGRLVLSTCILSSPKILWAAVKQKSPITLSSSEISRGCRNILGGAGVVEIPTRIPRLAVSKLTAEPYSLLTGLEAVSRERPAVVITKQGEDRLLAIDAKLAHQKGVRKFLHEILGASSCPDSWVAKIESRFANYEADDFVVKGLASLWHRNESLYEIDRFYFSRFFDSRLERGEETSYVSPEKADRIAIISLKIPGDSKKIFSGLWEQPVESTARPVASARPALPDNIKFQIPGFAKPRYVIIDEKVMKITGNLLKSLHKAIVEIADPLRQLTGEDHVLLTLPITQKSSLASEYFAYTYELEFQKNEAFESIFVRSRTPTTAGEVLSFQSDIVTSHLEPAKRLFSLPNKLDIFLPLALETLYTGSLGAKTMETAIQILNLQNPSLQEQLNKIEPGQSRFFKTAGEFDLFLRRFLPRSLLFHKSQDGRVYLVGFVDSAS